MNMMEDLVRSLIVGSPLGRLLGFEIEQVEPDRVRVRLPFRPEVTTIGDLVHGGAISALVDTAATAAAWTGAEPTEARGTTIGFSLNFLNGARGETIAAEARVIQRGRSIVICEVDVGSASGQAIARALVTYKLSSKASG